MSSIRLFILGSLAERGPMHGRGLILLAEEEHIDQWTDFAPSAVYGAIKRLAVEGLIAEVRVERQGNYPERLVYRISETGGRALHVLRTQGLSEIAIKPDPFNLVLARLDPETLDELPEKLEARLSELRRTLEANTAHLAAVTRYLTLAETWAMRHQLSRWHSEVAWHEELLACLPEIIADEKSRKDSK